MKSITESWIWRVFFGAWMFSMAFSYVYATVKQVPMPEIPWGTAGLTMALAGGEAALNYLKGRQQS